MELPDHLKYLNTVKILDNNKEYIAVYPLMFTDAIIIGDLNDHTGYKDRWCYEKGKAEIALEEWDGVGEPKGWHRHPSTGRRRPDGDPEQEYINK